MKLQRKIRERIAARKSVRDSKVTKKEKEEDGEKVRRRKMRRRRSRRSLKTDNADEVQDTDDVQFLDKAWFSLVVYFYSIHSDYKETDAM